MIPDKKALLYKRLEDKSLDQQFMQRIEKGMNCSPFTSEAITRVVKDVYFAEINNNLQPGQIRFQCLSVDNRAKTKILDSSQICVILTLDDSDIDYQVRKLEGVSGLRRHRMQRVCREAFDQGGVLTVEDLAYRLFNVGERTICRDLALFKKDAIILPLRSIVNDIGPAISHKSIIIKNWLKGDELSDLKRKYNHSYSAIENYIGIFKRVVFLKKEGYDIPRIAFTLKVSQKLVNSYLELLSIYQEYTVPHRLNEITDIVGQKASVRQKKRPGRHHENIRRTKAF